LYVLRMLFAPIKCRVFKITRSAVGVNRDVFWMDGIDSSPSNSTGVIANAKRLLEELEGISIEFDNWIAGIRARVFPNSNDGLVADALEVTQFRNTKEPYISVGAIKPFADSESLQHIARAIQQEIANELSRMRWLRVRLTEVRAEDCKFYHLSGIISESLKGRQLSMNLVDADDGGAIVWSGKFSMEQSEQLEVISSVASEVAGLIDPEISRVEFLRAQHSKQHELSKNGALLLAISKVYSFEQMSWRSAGRLIDQAIAADSYDSRALAYKSLHILTGAAQGWYSHSQKPLEDARYFSDKAIRNDSYNSIALSVGAHVSSFGERNFELALSNFDKAENSNPACGITQAYKSLTHSYLQNIEVARIAIDKARDTLVYDPYWSFIDACETVHLFFAEDFDAAIHQADRVLIYRPTFTNILKIKILSLCAVGDIQSATRTHEELLKLEPNFWWKKFFATYPFAKKDFSDSIISRVPSEFLA